MAEWFKVSDLNVGSNPAQNGHGSRREYIFFPGPLGGFIFSENQKKFLAIRPNNFVCQWNKVWTPK